MILLKSKYLLKVFLLINIIHLLCINCKRESIPPIKGIWQFCDNGFYNELHVKNNLIVHIRSNDTLGINYIYKIENGVLYYKQQGNDYSDSCQLNYINYDSLLMQYPHRNDTIYLTRIIDSVKDNGNKYLQRKNKSKCRDKQKYYKNEEEIDYELFEEELRKQKHRYRK